MSIDSLHIREALPGDLPELRLMHVRSLRILGRSHYDFEVIERFLSHVGTLDRTLVADRSYYVAEIDGRMAGSGGWSLRAPKWAVSGDAAAPAVPLLRGLYVDPDHARRGIGRALVTHAERAMRAAGHARARLVATLVAIPLYRSLGYRGGAPAVIPLPGGVPFVGIAMEKALAAAGVKAAA